MSDKGWKDQTSRTPTPTPAAHGFFSVSAERGAGIEVIAAVVAEHKLRTPIASDLTKSKA